jgi:hypothetical protein
VLEARCELDALAALLPCPVLCALRPDALAAFEAAAPRALAPGMGVDALRSLVAGEVLPCSRALLAPLRQPR